MQFFFFFCSMNVLLSNLFWFIFFNFLSIVDNTATTEVVQQRMIKTMSKGMTPAQVQVIEEHCTAYRLVEVIDSASREVDLNEIPWNLYQANKNITFYFKPPQEEGPATAEAGEVVALVSEEVLAKFEPINVWGCTKQFMTRYKLGISTLEDVISVSKVRRESEIAFMKTLSKSAKRPRSSQEKGTMGKAWVGVLGQQNQIIFLHEKMSSILQSHVVGPLEILRTKIDHEKTR
jgi:hypothetical protein